MEISESILTSIKKLLGIDENYTHFDADIIMHINSVFSILTQMASGLPMVSLFQERMKYGLLSLRISRTSFPWSNPMST